MGIQLNPIRDAVTALVKPLADKFFMDADKKKEFELEGERLAQNMDLTELEDSYKAIIAEAQSSDKWTSRARPSFMYVMYIIILASIPMGIVTAINPNAAVNIANGFKAWLAAIPDAMWGAFGVGYVGYSASRSYDKHMELKHGKK